MCVHTPAVKTPVSEAITVDVDVTSIKRMDNDDPDLTRYPPPPPP